MNAENDIPSRGFHRFAIATVLMAVFLIWWGAATTTEKAGMIFPDWPLSLGSINPPGWLSFLAPFLEHSHRIFAVIVGLMTLALFGWAFIRNSRTFWEFLALVLVLAAVTEIFRSGGAERQDGERQLRIFLTGAACCAIPVVWLIVGWKRRGWNLAVRLSALALLLVSLQAILGGLRVVRVSDNFAVIHGCLAQVVFCVLVLVAMASGPGWKTAPERDSFEGEQARPLRGFTTFLVLAVVIQLILGALMRHHHRHGLPDTGIFLTQGQWIPAFEPPELGILFLHKYWALVVFVAGVGMTLWLWTRRTQALPLLRHSLLISGLLVAQLTLGVSVLLTGDADHKSFWITNFHVLNGLAILALAFALAVRSRRANTRRTLLAGESGGPSESLPDSSA